MPSPLKRFLVTGGAGFIGSCFIRYGLTHVSPCEKIVNLDLLTYAADLHNLAAVHRDPRYLFVQGDIRNEVLVESLCVDNGIDAIVHFAAESHVDRSISTPRAFYDTNVGGTLALLEVIRRHPHIHFHHVSTDEVFGSLDREGYFTESSPYRPNSPYSASKAAADHFVRAYGHTYALATTLSYCTNNYGPGQHREKLIPLMIVSCLQHKPFPLYGKGENVRDWIFVEDHVEAIWRILEKRKKGQSYAIGGRCEKRNIDLVHTLIEELARITGKDSSSYRSLLHFVQDRPGHDLRYAIDASFVEQEIGWSPRHDFSQGIRKTIAWYLENLTKVCKG